MSGERKVTRSHALIQIALSILSIVTACGIDAQAYPVKPVPVIVASSAPQ